MASRRLLAVVVATVALSSCGRDTHPHVLASGDYTALCRAASAFSDADRVVQQVALSSHERQVAAHQVWVDALDRLATQLPSGSERDDAHTLENAPTAVSDQPWTKEQQDAYDSLLAYIGGQCSSSGSGSSSSDLPCAAAAAVLNADRAVKDAVSSSTDRRQAARQAWVDALDKLAAQLAPGPALDAVNVLRTPPDVPASVTLPAAVQCGGHARLLLSRQMWGGVFDDVELRSQTSVRGKSARGEAAGLADLLLAAEIADAAKDEADAGGGEGDGAHGGSEPLPRSVTQQTGATVTAGNRAAHPWRACAAHMRRERRCDRTVTAETLRYISPGTRRRPTCGFLAGQAGDRGDLNPRPPGPQPGALTELSYGHHVEGSV
jgi:hypothetical protein